jgi:hypothetical protein
LVAFDKEGEVTIDTHLMNDIDSLKEASLADGIDSDDAQIVHVVGFTNSEIFDCEIDITLNNSLSLHDNDEHEDEDILLRRATNVSSKENNDPNMSNNRA